MRNLIVICLLTLSVLSASDACRDSDDFLQFYSEELGVHKSLFAFVESIFENNKRELTSSSFFPITFGKTLYNARIHIKKAEENKKERLSHALLEAKIMSEFLELTGAQFGYLNPEFFDCEYGTATISATKEVVNYVIILSEHLPHTFKIVKSKQNALINEMSKKKPLERLNIYLKISRSLENTHLLGILHNQIEPNSIGSDLTLKAPKLIRYEKSQFISEEAQEKIDEEFSKDQGSELDPTTVNADFFIKDVNALILSFYQLECEAANFESEVDYSALYAGKKIEEVSKDVLKNMETCFKSSKIDALKGFGDLLKSMTQSFEPLSDHLRYSSSKLAADLLKTIRLNKSDFFEDDFLNPDSIQAPINEIKDEELGQLIEKFIHSSPFGKRGSILSFL